jgi:PAS domain S-box-containing protein
MSPDVDRFYRTLVCDAPDAIIYADSLGVITFWNKAAERVFGFSRSDAIGKTLDIIIPEDLRKRHWDGFAQTIRTGKTRYGAGDVLAVPALRKDGTRVSIEFTILPFADRAGRILGMAAILRDVTQRFAELKRLRKELASSRPS